MKLYVVKYRTWNRFFSGLTYREKISVGNNEEEAIERVKAAVDNDAEDFEAEIIEDVFGYKILVI